MRNQFKEGVESAGLCIVQKANVSVMDTLFIWLQAFDLPRVPSSVPFALIWMLEECPSGYMWNKSSSLC